MKTKFKEINQSLDGKIRNACEGIPPKKRKFVVLGLCFSFVVAFSFMLWNSIHNEEVQKLIKIEHITPLDLPQDSLAIHFKKYLHGK